MFGRPSDAHKTVVPMRYDCHPGDLIESRYRVESVLGNGSFGCVYKVVDMSKKCWALKLLRLWDVPSDIRQQLVERFEMEFKTGRIPNENLVHSVDYGYLNGNPYIVMEFCDGGDLKAKIGDRSADLVHYAKCILSGLKALHMEGKVHRDLKPENVLLKSNNIAVLTDFGISGDRNKRMTERNIFGKPYQIFGTYAYMPPEQVNRGKSTVLPTTDIFSFGVLMYQMITGILPFGSLDDQNDLVRYQKRGAAGDWNKPALLAALNGKKWYNLIDGCLKPDYRQRLQSVDDVLRLVPFDISMPARDTQPDAVQAVKNATAAAVAREARLVVTQGPDYGLEINLTSIVADSKRCVITFGRDTSNCVCLKEYDEPYLSRRHFTIEMIEQKDWIIRDGQWNPEQRQWIGSSNGTFVNSTEISKKGLYLQQGDIITAGDIKLKFVLK